MCALYVNYLHTVPLLLPLPLHFNPQDWDTNKGEHVKHYRIRVAEGGNYYIVSTQAFKTLNDLVEAYKSE